MSDPVDHLAAAAARLPSQFAAAVDDATTTTTRLPLPSIKVASAARELLKREADVDHLADAVGRLPAQFTGSESVTVTEQIGVLGPTARTFWISATGQDNAAAIDDALLRRILERTRAPGAEVDAIVLNAEQVGFGDVADRIHAIDPSMKVVLYFHCQKLTQSTKQSGEDYDADYAERQRIGLMKTNGQAKVLGTAPRATLWGDMTVARWRSLRTEQAIAAMVKYHCDGVVGDNTHGDLNPITNSYAGTLQLEEHCSGITSRIFTTDGSACTLAIVADGAGVGSLTKVGSAYVFHCALGTTSHLNLEAAVNADATGIISVCYASPTPSTKLAAGDVIGATALDGRTEKGRAWLGGCYSMYDAIKADPRMAGKIVWFNGLWNNKFPVPGQYDQFPNQVSLQASILAQHADGATVEFYGKNAISDPQLPDDPYEEFAIEIDAAVVALTTKTIFIHGTTSDAYYTYRQNLQNARYCHACYLTGARRLGDHTSFFFSQDYQMARLPRSRAGGLAQYAYLDLALGDPTALKVSNGTGGFSRDYEGGVVYLAPENRGLQIWTTTEDLWSTTGVLFPAGTTHALTEGDARYLLRAQPAPPLALGAVISDYPSEWLLEMSCLEWRRRTCSIRYRTSDVAASYHIRGEVDDPPVRPYGIAHVIAQGGSYSPGTTDEPYRQVTTQLATHSQAPVTLIPDGQEHVIDVDLEDAFWPLPVYRIPSIRALGSIETLSITLHDPTLVDAPVDPGAPIPNFDASVTNLLVAFTNTSIDNDGVIVAHFWDFGDGSTSTAASPSHTYATVGDKVVTLTEIDDDGKVATFSKVVHATIDTDGPQPVYMPITALDFAALELTAPQHSWSFQMASGNASDAIGAMTLTANLIAEYQDVDFHTLASGWARSGARFDETVSQRFRTTTGPNSATTPTMLVMVVYLEKPAGTSRLLASLGTNVDIRQRTTGKLFVNANGSSTDGTAVYDGNVYLVALHNDPTNNAGGAGTAGLLEYETSVNTPTPVKVTSGYTDPTGTTIAIGPIGAVAAFKGVILQAWLWDSGTFPTVNDLATKMGWVEVADA